MTLAQLTSVIDQGADLGLTDVYFEGGEPTLAYPIVLAAAKHARERGLDVGIVSNCFWATSVADAKVWLAPFAELGLADLSLSSYAYFVEDANEEQLRNAVLAAQELGIPASVLEVGAPADIGVPGACSGDVGEVMHKGRAAVALAPARASRPPETLATCPFEDFADPGRAHVGPDGELQVCQGISAGNVFAGGDGPPAPEDLAEPRPGGLSPCSTPTTRSPAPSSARSSPAAPGPSPWPWDTRPSAHITPTNATYATKSAPPCAPPAAHPEVVAPGQCYAENEPRRETMPSECEGFWDADSYAVIGHQASKKPYPKITYGALKERGKTVYAMDPDGGTVEGDTAYADFASLPGPVRGRRDGAPQGGDRRAGSPRRPTPGSSRSGSTR